MKKKLVAFVAFLCLAVVAFTACSSAAHDASGGYSKPSGGGAYDYVGSDEDSAAPGVPEGAATIVITEDRLIVYTVNMSMSVDKLSATMKNVAEKVKESGGWVANSYFNDENFVEYTLRIPTKNLDEFIASIEEGSELNYKSVSSEDITDKYVEIEEKKNALEAEKLTLEKAINEGNLSNSEKREALTRLNEIARLLDQYKTKLNAYKKETDYSTVNLSIYQKGSYVKASAWDKVGDVFFGSGKSVGTVIGWLIVAFVAILPYLGVVVAAFGLYVLIKFIICKITKKKFTLFAKARENSMLRKARREELKHKYEGRHAQNAAPTRPARPQSEESVDGKQPEENSDKSEEADEGVKDGEEEN